MECSGQAATLLSEARGDAELKSVHQLVTEDVVGFAERPRQRHHQPTAQSFGDAAGGHSDEAGDGGGGAKVRVIGVEDDGLRRFVCGCLG